MKKRMIQLHNTLGLIETKGEGTLMMAECILTVRGFINELNQKEAKGEGDDRNESEGV